MDGTNVDAKFEVSAIICFELSQEQIHTDQLIKVWTHQNLHFKSLTPKVILSLLCMGKKKKKKIKIVVWFYISVQFESEQHLQNEMPKICIH